MSRWEDTPPEDPTVSAGRAALERSGDPRFAPQPAASEDNGSWWKSATRVATAVPQGISSGLYDAVMLLPDMSGRIARTLGLVSPDTPLPSEMIREAGRNFRDKVGFDYNPNIVPETKGERIAMDVGNAIGQVAATAVPGGIVASAARAPVAGLRTAIPTFGQTVGRQLAAQPGLQLAGTAAGNVATDLTGNPYIGLGTSLAVPTAVQGAMRIPFAAPARTGAEVERRALLKDAKGEGVLPSFGTVLNNYPAKIAESVLGKLPFVGGTQARLQADNKTAFDRAAFNKVPEVAGEGIDAATIGNRDMVRGRIDRTFDDLLNSTTINVDPQVGADMVKARADFSKRLADQMPGSILSKLDELQSAATTPDKPGATSVTLDGNTYKDVRSKLIAQLATTRGTDKAAIGAMIDALDGAVERSLPRDLVPDWQNARTSARRFRMIDDATDAQHNAQTDVGHIPPSALAARAGNDKEMQRLAQIGTSFVGDKRPDRGTALGHGIMTGLGLLPGAGAGALGMPMTAAALTGGGYLTNLALNNPYMRAAMINRLQRSREGVLNRGLMATLAAQQAENDAR
jgi:hypothetical protein